MAHTCPECGMQCHCKGDFDDIDLGREPPGGCVHYMRDSCDYNNYDEDEDFFDDFDDNDHPLNPLPNEPKR